MKFTKSVWFLMIFSALYVIAFTAYYLSIKNFEFLWYVLVLVFFFVLILATLRRSKFSLFILWGLSLWGLMHMAGGGLIVNGEVLYKYVIFPFISDGGDFTILKFDQFVHFFGFGVSTFVVYHLLKPYLNKKTNYAVLYSILFAAGMGLGALNEIVEFVAVLAVPDTNVGGYINTGLDLVFNAFGVLTAVIIIHIKRKKEIGNWKNK